MTVTSISPFPIMLSTLSMLKVILLAMFNSLSATALNLEESGILSCGTQLALYHITNF